MFLGSEGAGFEFLKQFCVDKQFFFFLVQLDV